MKLTAPSFVPPTPVSHALPQLCRTPNMGSQRVLPGPCSGKQDTSEHTWAEVKTNWAASCWGSVPKLQPAQTGELKSSSVGWLGIPLASSDPDSCSSQVWGSVWQWNSFNAA